MKIISLYSNIDKVGGAQKVSISIHKGLINSDKNNFGFYSSKSSYTQIDSSFKKELSKKEYQKFNLKTLILKHSDAVFISHHRKITTLLIIVSFFLFKKIKLFHVSHNEFTNLKLATLFPKNIIAVSEGVKRNLVSYFKLKNVRVIYNGIYKQNKTIYPKALNKGSIKILLPGRVTEVKQQLKIVEALKGRIPKGIQILFAGEGPDLDKLINKIGNDLSFKVLGYISDMDELYDSIDFVLLFSLKEGLPLSLIEAQSFGIPIICNSVGGNLEILKDKENGYLISSFEEMLAIFKTLLNLTPEQYQKMSSTSIDIFNEKFSYRGMIMNYISFIKEQCKIK